MTQAVQRAKARSDLGSRRAGHVVSGVFAVDGSHYEMTFAGEAELARFVDFALSSPIKPATTRLYLHPDEVPTRPEHQVPTCGSSSTLTARWRLPCCWSSTGATTDCSRGEP